MLLEETERWFLWGGGGPLWGMDGEEEVGACEAADEDEVTTSFGLSQSVVVAVAGVVV